MSNQEKSGPQQQPKKNLVERLDALEFQVSRFTALQGLVMNLRKSVQATVETMMALTEELGGQELVARVIARLDEKQAAQRREQAERSEAVLNQLIESGQVEAQATIDSESIVTGVESTVNGKVKDEKLQMPLSQFTDDVREELLGKAVGYAVVRQEVTVFKVTGIFKMKEFDPKSLTEAAAPVPAEAQPEAPSAEPPQIPVEPQSVDSAPTTEQAATAPAAE